ncbi:hypothetical protein [Roseateles sp.]|uniref:hypothetical protein n=1 Tax=Roseateles sp. TaxID=1971397 RepID=UPI0025E87DBA|nr:hypothetical protein [Roseateles sp.]MBV8035311.1 hypothetical protein [Roseateles sp.]
MIPDAPPQDPMAETRPRPVWSLLTRLWSPAAAAGEAELGYESALPWTLGEPAPTDGNETRY